MIPAEAVEAAAKAWLSHTLRPVSLTLEDGMREILEAAAPHLLAQGWDEGYEQADIDAPHAIKSENPYRSQVAPAKDLASMTDGSVVRDMVKDGDAWYHIGSGRIVPRPEIQEDKP